MHQDLINNFYEECEHEETIKTNKAALARSSRAKRTVHKDRKNKIGGGQNESTKKKNNLVHSGGSNQ